MSETPTYEDGWQPIATAPKDGTAFLAYWLRRHTDGTRYEAAQPYVVARYERDRMYPSWIGDDTPTHWMPLPAPPAQETEAEGRNTEGGSVHEGSVGEADAPID